MSDDFTPPGAPQIDGGCPHGRQGRVYCGICGNEDIAARKAVEAAAQDVLRVQQLEPENDTLKARVTEQDDLIDELREENERLRRLLQRYGHDVDPNQPRDAKGRFADPAHAKAKGSGTLRHLTTA